MISEKELKEKRKKINKEFFSNFKKNFDIDRLIQDRYSTGTYVYDDLWKFENLSESALSSTFNIVFLNPDGIHNISLEGGDFFKLKVKDFIIDQLNKKEELRKRKVKMRNLDLLESHLAKAYPNTLETFETLEKGKRWMNLPWRRNKKK